MADSGSYLFLSRPRRFGKSLLVDTLRCLFEAREELFQGLWIHDKWDWDKEYSVIKIDMGNLTNYDLDSFISSLKNFFSQLYQAHDLHDRFDEKLSPKDLMSNLVRYISAGSSQKVVILIDEYDKPILDNINRRDYAVAIRDYLRGFYEVFKGLDEHIRFFFMTGVSKFSRVSLFSGLNNLKDLSLYPEFGSLLGYTELEILESFSDYLHDVDEELLAYWYNGYNFLGDERVYNPFDVLQFLDTKKYQNYWFKTGTPSFLIKILMERDDEPDIARIENTEISADLLDAFDVYTMPIETLLFQSGYLTIDEEVCAGGEFYYKLVVPNYEVRQSLNKEFLFSYLRAGDIRDDLPRRQEIWKALRDSDIELFLSVIRALFAGIPYSSVDLARYEDYYKSVLYAFLLGAGLEVICEDITARGRIDLSVRLPEIYEKDSPVIVMELKVLDRKEGAALDQIKKKGYHEKYMDRPCFIVGLEFDKAKKKLYSQWERV